MKEKGILLETLRLHKRLEEEEARLLRLYDEAVWAGEAAGRRAEERVESALPALQARLLEIELRLREEGLIHLLLGGRHGS